MTVRAVPKPSYRRRTRQRPAEFTPKVKREIHDRQDGICYLCPGPIHEFHHCYSRQMGGTSRPELGEAWNGVGLCIHCHRRVEASQELKLRLRAEADERRATNEATVNQSRR